MTKRVQIAGGSTALADAFTGFERELYVDTTRDELRIHDGVTAGGHRVQNKTQADAAYQPIDADLTAVAALDATAGFLIKTGAATYARRTLTGTAAEITVTYGDGVAGNPVLSLPAAMTLTGKTLTGGTFSAPTITGVVGGTATSQTITAITCTSINGVTAATAQYTTAEASKLAGIEASADVTDATNVAAAGAAMATNNGSDYTEATFKANLNMEAGVDYLAYSANVVYSATTKNLTVGYTQTSYNIGNTGAGTVTPLIANGSIQHATVTGAFTLAAPTDSTQGYIEIEITNDGTGGYSPDLATNFTAITGTYDSTASVVQLLQISKHNTNVYLSIVQGA